MAKRIEVVQLKKISLNHYLAVIPFFFWFDLIHFYYDESSQTGYAMYAQRMYSWLV